MPEGSGSNSNAIMSVLMAICLGISSFSLKWGFDANAELKVMTVQMETMNKTLQGLNKKTELDKKQDSQISKFWRLHSWTKKEIDSMRFKDGDGPSDWPDLGSSDWN